MDSKVIKIKRRGNTTEVRFQKRKTLVEVCSLTTSYATSFIEIGDEMRVEGKHAIWNPKQKGISISNHEFTILDFKEESEFIDAGEILCQECFHSACYAIEMFCKEYHPDFYDAAKKSAVSRLFVNVETKEFELRISKTKKITCPFKEVGVKEIKNGHLEMED